MGDVVSLSDRRGRQRPTATARSAPRGRATFFLDLASPYTYLAAERVDRLLTGVRWTPVLADALVDPAADAAGRAAAQERAAALRMPLVWPDPKPAPARVAMRIALHAERAGRAPAFVLAASRLAFCGGFDVDDPSILAEAAAAAGLALDDCLRAAGDRGLDDVMRAAGERLVTQGAALLPAVRVGRSLFCGEHRLTEAVACTRAQVPPGQAEAASPWSPSAG